MRALDPDIRLQASAPLSAVIIGAGFGGIGMAVALRRQGIHDFVIIEKAGDVGGVWRDNRYPGAACDVPSHLYSFSFEPNPRWSYVFARQPEIADYLRRCSEKYELLPHLRFHSEVQHASYDEEANLWRVTLADGSVLSARLLISGVGQLSRPAHPQLPGMADFAGHSFHSARWDHDYPLDGKRVAVVGTGASAVQFVPPVARQVQKLSVFQRSPAYIIPRPDRAYSNFEKAMFERLPWTTKLYRVGIYLRYESRALAFTRFQSLLKLAAGLPFKWMLKKQVPDPALRARLMPDYPIGCKRLLLSSDYLETLARPNVEVVTDGIRRVTAEGIETADGRVHAVDAIIYGTGFAATEFLSPMRISGRDGVDLNDAWRRGAMAYLGMTVPGFPNFFMLYGPNTNLGHNSIVYMLESQIRHVMRCLKAMQRSGSDIVEAQTDRYRRFNIGIQQRLAHSVWSGCKSWYVDANGHNSTNWPGFTFTYRWLTRHSSLQAYRFTAKQTGSDGVSAIRVAAPSGLLERINASAMRLTLRTCFRPWIGTPYRAATQRRIVAVLSLLMPGRGGVFRYRSNAQGVPLEVLAPRNGESGAAMLYLHGGAFCLGGPHSHRGVTTHLAIESGMMVWVPDYRLAPEHPYPAALEDVLCCYRALQRQGYRPEQIVVAGDSAGGALALSLAMELRRLGEAQPAGLALISPFTDGRLSGASLTANAAIDPMLRIGWLQQGVAWYAEPANPQTSVLDADLKGLPPMIIQVGDQEILLSDSMRLAANAARSGVDCTLEIHAERWHVFHLQSLYLRSAVRALQTLAEFARLRVASAPKRVTAAAPHDDQEALAVPLLT